MVYSIYILKIKIMKDNKYKNISILPVHNMYAVYDWGKDGIKAEKLYGFILGQKMSECNEYVSINIITNGHVSEGWIDLEDFCHDENLLGIIDENPNPYQSIEDIRNANFIPFRGNIDFDSILSRKDKTNE